MIPEKLILIYPKKKKKEIKHKNRGAPTAAESEAKRIGKFSKRFDVVKKTIFRNVKKHIAQEFKRFYDYTKRRRSSKIDYNSEIFNNAKKFVFIEFGQNAPEGLDIILVAIVDIKGKYRHRNSQYETMRIKLFRLIK
jgi:hypothetical protein